MELNNVCTTFNELPPEGQAEVLDLSEKTIGFVEGLISNGAHPGMIMNILIQLGVNLAVQVEGNKYTADWMKEIAAQL